MGFVVMVLLGEWFCVRREMQDIPLSEWLRAGSSVEQTAAAGQLRSLAGKWVCSH